MIAAKDQKFLLKVARQAIERGLKDEELEIDEKEASKAMEKPAAVFVTLTKNKELRGCIGSLEAQQPLLEAVVGNALNAAFHDPRFEPVRADELKEIRIEISILSEAKEITFSSEKELLEKIDEKMGIILESGARRSTFLPQVWKQIEGKKEFLEQLSLKAGAGKDAWKTAVISFYRVEEFHEKH